MSQYRLSLKLYILCVVYCLFSLQWLQAHLSWLPPAWILQKQLPLILSSSSVLLCFLTLSSEVFEAFAALSSAEPHSLIWALYLASKFNHMTFA